MLPPHPLESGESDRRYGFTFSISSTGEYWVSLTVGIRPGNVILQPKIYIQTLKLSAEDFCGPSSPPPNDDCDLPRRQWRIVEVPELLVLSMRNDKYITIDAHTKKVSANSHPVYHGHQERSKGFMEMGGFLASWVLGLLHQYDDALTLSVLVKDFHTGEWIHQYSVRIDPDFLSLTGTHYPVLSFGNGEVIIFRNVADKTLWAYNVESHRRWEVGTNLKEWDDISFYDFHVKKDATLESLYSN